MTVDRKGLLARVQELGYERVRDAKHSTLYRHPATGARIGVPHTPGDHRSLKNTLAEAERGAAVTPQLRKRAEKAASHVGAVVAVLKSSAVPMTTGELAELLMVRGGASLNAAQSMVGRAARTQRNIVRPKRGWNVWDPELAALPPQERRTACDELVRIGLRRAYRQPELRAGALRLGSDLAAKPEAETPPSTPTPAEPTRAAPATELFEAIAAEPDNSVMILRGEDGRLWLARPLSTYGGAQVGGS